MPCQVKKCLSNVGGGGGGADEEGNETNIKEKQRQSSSPYVFMSPEVRTTVCKDDALQIHIASIIFRRNILDDVMLCYQHMILF